MIIKELCSVDKCVSSLAKLIDRCWPLFSGYSTKLAKQIEEHLKHIPECEAILIEYPYVDKVYRNSYYRYYASKNNGAYRDCFRLSFLNKEIEPENLSGKNAMDVLQKVYLGYMVLRPTPISIVGRSAISPVATRNKLSLCLAPISSTTGGVKVNITAFPHSSQDSETISCAETTIWSLMEYYSSKYPDYRPVLPADILKVLSSLTSERQLPSVGLNISQIAFALKTFGFGPRIYSAAADRHNFGAIVSTYIESGIPVIAALENEDKSIGHANLIIGRSTFTVAQIQDLKKSSVSDYDTNSELDKMGFEYFDFHKIDREYVFNDDNFPAYQLANFDHPCRHYDRTDWDTCTITTIATPLYHKMYLEASIARKYIELYLFNVTQVQKSRPSILTRLFMASSRSYKHYLAVKSEIKPNLRELLLKLEMAKFIWVCELSTKELMAQQKADGFVILDATEANYQSQECLMAACCDGKLSIKPDKYNLENFHITLPPFSIYAENLIST